MATMPELSIALRSKRETASNSEIRTLDLDFHPRLWIRLEQLLETGLFGHTLEETIECLLSLGVRSVIGKEGL